MALSLGHLGAAVLRLETRPHVAVPGHALLIGSPLRDLGGVDTCLQRVGDWLGPDYATVEGPAAPTKANIEAMVQRLLDGVRWGDQVLLYYAGHGKQWLPERARHPEPVAALMPIDTDDSTPGDLRLIPGYQLVEWLRQLARACGSTLPRSPGRRAAPEPCVTVILECCHAAGLLGDWPSEQEVRVAIEKSMAQEAGTRSFDPVPQVLRVMATGRDEVAQGPSGGDVGLMTRALVDVLERHPDEPWWALWDRLRATWTEPTQHPRMAGPLELIPRLGRRHPRPDDLMACRSLDGVSWQGSLISVAGWTPGRRVVLNAALAGPQQAWGRVERVEQAQPMQLRVPEGSAVSELRFAWATRLGPDDRAAVDVWGGARDARDAVIRRLAACVAAVRDRESAEHPAVAPRFGSRVLPLHHPVGFEVGDDAVSIHDRWGDVVARTSLDDVEVWRAWIDRLTALDDWLEIQRCADWPEEGVTLRWGRWRDGEREPWGERPPEDLTSRTPLWIEVRARFDCVPAYASMFRLRADRALEALTRHVPAGLPMTGRYPVASLGAEGRPLLLPRASSDVQGARSEELVVLVSDRPLPMTMLELGPVGKHRPWSSRGRESQGARLGMYVRRYRHHPVASLGVEPRRTCSDPDPGSFEESQRSISSRS